MKTFLSILPILFLFGVEPQNNQPPLCSVSYFYGNVALKEPPQEWNKAQLDQSVKEGEWLRTQTESRCELTIIDGTVIRIDESTNLQIEGLEVEGDPILHLKLNVPLGRIWTNVKKLSKGSKFNVKNPVVVAGVRGTVYSMDVLPDSSAKIKVYKGEVNVSNEPLKKRMEQKKGLGKVKQVPGPHQIKGPQEVSIEQWLVIVKAQQEMWISKTGRYSIKPFSIEKDIKKNEWAKWNIERDKSLKR